MKINCRKLMALAWLVPLVTCILSPQANATISFTDTSKETTNVSNSTTPFSTTTTTLYYSNVAATDAGATGFFDEAGGPGCSTAVNPRCRNPADTFTLPVSSSLTASGVSQMRFFVSTSALSEGTNITGQAGFISSVAYPTTGNAVSLSTTFGNICTKAVNAGITCTGGATLENDCGLTNSTGSCTIPIRVIMDASGGDTYTAADDDVGAINLVIQNRIRINAASTGTVAGLYSFLAFPGDEKVRMKNVIVPADSTFPSTENNVGIQYARFFFAAGPSTCASAASFSGLGLNYVTNSALSYADLTFQSDANFTTNIIKPLTNGTRYYFKAALVDFAGNIGYLTPDSDDDCTHSAKPDQVIGLMEQSGNCFVATAAFGSPMSPYVKILRQYRDDVLLKQAWGRSFVNWYFKVGPKIADVVGQNEALRTATRGFLYPVIGISYLALKWGTYNAIIFMFTLIMLPLLVLRYRQTKKQSGEQ